MSPQRITADSLQHDWTTRYFTDLTVDASPAAAAETIIATVTVTADLRAEQGVLLFANAAFVVGTDGTSARLRIRRTNAAGTAKADTEAIPATPAAKMLLGVWGFDALGAAVGQVYVATLTVAAGSAPSTLSSVALVAVVI